ncbi:MAG: major capsid protein [Candidatus Thiodiazotropha endolucinida]|nr:major capsid protein [Candidatus Thiodiazotropha taylori]MCW4321596.1 major capsid protein [Candidatus Thiodiazotropha taylori]
MSDVEAYVLEIKSDADPNWKPIAEVDNPNEPFDVSVSDALGPNYYFRVRIRFSDGSMSSEASTPIKQRLIAPQQAPSDGYTITRVEEAGVATIDGDPATKYLLHFEPNEGNVAKESDVLTYALMFSKTGSENFVMHAAALASPFTFYALQSDAPDFYFKVQAYYKNGGHSSISSSVLKHVFNDNPGVSDGGGGAGGDIVETRCKTLGLTYNSALIMKAPVSSVSVDITGFENIAKEWQLEYSFTISLRGYAWDTVNGGRSPTNDKLSNLDHWKQITTSRKDTFGVMLITS